MQVINGYKPFGAHLATAEPKEESVMSTAVLLCTRSFTGSVNGLSHLRYTEGFEYELPIATARAWEKAGYGRIIDPAAHDAKGAGEHQAKKEIVADETGATDAPADEIATPPAVAPAAKPPKAARKAKR